MNFLDSVVINKPSFYLEDYVWTVYGVPGAGKTTFALNLVKENFGGYQNGILFAFDKGYKTMRGVHALPVTGWAKFLKDVDNMIKQKDKHEYRVVIFDTISKAYDMAEKYILAEESKKRRKTITSMSEIPYGGAYNMLDDAISDVVEKLQNNGFGLIFIEHDNHIEETTREGEKYNMITSSLSKRGRRYIFGLSDVIMFLDYSKHKDDDGELYSERKLHLSNDNTLAETKNRFRGMPATLDTDAKLFLEEVKKSVESDYDSEEEFEEAQKERLEVKESEPIEHEDVHSAETDREALVLTVMDKTRALSDEDRKTMIAKIKKKFNSTKVKDFTVEQLEELLEMF